MLHTTICLYIKILYISFTLQTLHLSEVLEYLLLLETTETDMCLRRTKSIGN